MCQIEPSPFTHELPIQSVREIIANACLHRNYLDSSAVQVSIYDDRIEVDSPGMLYDGLNLTEAMSGKSKCRNKAIAEAFQYMKIIEGWGTGLPRLFRQCSEMNLPKPKFEEFGDGIKVTIYRGVDRIMNGPNDINDTINDTNDTKNDTNQRIIALLKKNGNLTQKQISEILGLSIITVKRSMGKMQKDLILEHVGTNRKGYWKVTSGND